MSGDSQISAPLCDLLEIYKAMIAASPDAVTMTDLSGRIIYVSPQTLALHGYGDESELMGRSAFDLIAPEDHREALANLKLTLEQGQVKGLEYKLLRKDGQRFIGELNTALVRDGQGRPQAFIAFTRDITERKRAETALQQSEERYKTLLESVTDYTYTVEIEDGRPARTRHGPNCLAVTGYSPEDYAANPLLWHAMIHEDDKQRVADHAGWMLMGQAAPIEHRIIHKDGGIRWVRNTPVPRFDKQGQLVSYDGTVTDITERKNSEEAVRESREHYRLLVELSPDGVMVHSHGRVVFINDRGAGILGAREPGDLIGKAVIDLVPPEFREQVQKRIGEMYSLQVSYSTIEQKMIKVDGEQIEVELTPAGFIYQNGLAVLAVFRDITERKRTVEALRSSEEINRAISQESPLGISVRNRNGKLVSYNRAWQKIWAMSDAEVRRDLDAERAELRLDDKDGYLGPWADKVVSIYRQGGVLKIPELRIVKPAFEGERHISQHFYALKSGSGHVERVVVITEDITERKRDKELLRESEERYRQLVELSPDAVAVHCNGRLAYANPTCINLFGAASSEEVLGREVLDFVHSEFKDTVRQRIGAMLTQGTKSPLLEEKFVKLDGTTLEVEVAAGPFIYQGQPSVLVAFRDITERRKTERSLRESEERHRLLLNGIRLPVLALKENMTIYYCNQAFADFVGKDLGSLEGRFLTELFPSFGKTKSHQAQLECIKTGNTREVEGEFRGRHMHAWIYRTGNGILAVGEDVTEKKKAEEILKRDVETFQKMVDQKTTELTNIQQKMHRAERLSELGRMSMLVAHELRNPLGVMRLAAFNIGRKKATPDICRHVKNIEKKIVESEKIINNLLGFARIQTPQREKIELYKILRDCAADIRSRYPRIRMTSSLNAIRGVWIEADSGQLREVFQNTLENAAQASADGRGDIEVHAELQKAGIAVYIRDEGAGVAPVNLTKVFKPFFTTKSKGIGLGLSIAKELMELHRGGIRITNRNKGGAEVRVWIPNLRKEEG